MLLNLAVFVAEWNVDPNLQMRMRVYTCLTFSPRLDNQGTGHYPVAKLTLLVNVGLTI